MVSDYDRALKFYRDALGFEVTADVTDPHCVENRWLTLKPRSGQTSIMLLKASPAHPEFGARLGKPTLLVFHTVDINTDCARIASHGGQVLSAPKRAGWGDALEVHFRDPDGNTFLLIRSNGSRLNEGGE
jgi:predicted enzyme related to lactoylglutathione lyase